jgi:hypothetical protein
MRHPRDDGGPRVHPICPLLARVKAAWDPDNVFRLNKNIAPRA